MGVSYVKAELLNQQQQKTMTGVRSRMKISKPVTFSLPSYDPRLPRKGLPLLPSCSFSFWIYRRQHSQVNGVGVSSVKVELLNQQQQKNYDWCSVLNENL